MKSTPKIGALGQRTFVVTEQHAIDFADEHMPAVLSTPWLIWFLEHAARETMLPLLDRGESTVGVYVEVQHLAATPLDGRVTARARVIAADPPTFSFQLEAHDEHELIARGLHRLRVIQASRLRRRVEAKQGTRRRPE